MKLVMDRASHCLFASLTSGSVARIDLANFTRTGTLVVADGTIAPAIMDLVGALTTLAVAPLGGHLFSATQGADRAVVRHIDITGGRFAIAASMLLLPSEASVATMMFLPDAAAATAGTPAGRLYASVVSIGRVGLLLEILVDANGTLTRGRSVDNAGGESWGTDMSYDARTGSVIVPIRNNPGRVTRLRLSDMSRVTTITLPSGVEFAYSAVLDTLTRRVYIVCLTTPLAIATLDADDLSLLNVMSVATAKEALEFSLVAVLDPVSGYIYCGLGTTPGSLLIMDASRGAAAGGGGSLGGQLIVAGAVRQQNVFAGRTQRAVLLERPAAFPVGTAPPAAATSVFSASSRQGLWRLRSDDLSIAHYMIAPLVRNGPTRQILDTEPAPAPVGSLAHHPPEDRLYMGMLSAPAQVLRVAVTAGLLLEGALDLPAGLDLATALVVAPARNSLLVGIGGVVTGVGAVLVEIALPAFTASTTVPLNYQNCAIATGTTFCVPVPGSAGGCTAYGFFVSTPQLDGRILVFRVDLTTLVPVSNGFYIPGVAPPSSSSLRPSALIEGFNSTAWIVMSAPPPASASATGSQLLSSQPSLVMAVSLLPDQFLRAVRGIPLLAVAAAPSLGLPSGPVVGGGYSPSRNATVMVTGGPAAAVYTISRTGNITAAAALPAPAFAAAWDEAAAPGGALFLASATAESISDAAMAAAAAVNASSGHGAVVRVPLAPGSAQPMGIAAAASNRTNSSSSSSGSAVVSSASTASQRALDVPVSATPPGASFVFDGHLYLVGGRLRSAAQRIRLADFATAGSVTLPLEDTAGSATLLPGRRTAIITGHTTGAALEVELPSMAVRAWGSVPMYARASAAFEGDPRGQALAVYGTTGGFVFLLNLTSASGVNALATTYMNAQPGYTSNFWTAGVAHTPSRRAYMVSLSGALLRVDPDRFSTSVATASNIIYRVSLRNANSIVVDSAGSFAYVGTRTEPARVIQLSISPSGPLGVTSAVIQMASGLDNFVNSALLSLPFPFGEFAVFATGSESLPATLQAVSLPGMALLQPIPLKGNVASTMAVAPGTSHLYVGTYTFPQRVFRLDAGALITSVLSGAAPPGTSSLQLSPGQGEGVFSGALAAMVPPQAPQAQAQAAASAPTGSTNASLVGAAAANGATGILIAGAGTGAAAATAGVVSLSLPSLQPLSRLGNFPSGEDYFGAADAYVLPVPPNAGAGADTRATSLQGQQQLLGWAFLCTDRRLTGGVNASAESVVKVAVSRSGVLARETALQLPRLVQGIVFAALVQEDDSASSASSSSTAAAAEAPALYVGGALNPGSLARVNTSTMTVTTSIALPSSATGMVPGSASNVVAVLVGGAVDQRRRLLYVAVTGASPSPARILRFTLPDLVLSGPPLMLASSVGGGWAGGDIPRSIAFDPTSGTAGHLLVGAAAWSGYISVLAATGDTSPGAASTPIAAYIDTVPVGAAGAPSTSSAVRSMVVDAAAGFAFAALDGDPPSIAQLRLGSRLAGTPGAGPGAGRITATITAGPGTPRIGITLAPPPAGAPAGSPSLVLAGSESIPGILLGYEATPPAPAVASIDAGLLKPPPALCDAVRARGWEWGDCVYAASEMPPSSASGSGGSGSSGSVSGGNWTLRGSFFGHFTPPSQALLALRAAPVVRLLGQLRLLRSGDVVGDGGSSAVLPGSGQRLGSCSDFGCSDGRTCWCTLPPIPAAAVPRVSAAGNESAVQLSITMLSVGMSLDDVPDNATDAGAAAPLLVAVVSGAPSILSVEPPFLASHAASLRVTMALGPRGFDAAHGDAIALVGEESPAAAAAAGVSAPRRFNLTCVVASPAAVAGGGVTDGQVISCVPPPLRREYLSVRFDAVLRRSGSEVFRLQAAVRYAWPVLASVSPVDRLPADGNPPQTLTIIAPAIVTDAGSSLASPLPLLTVWVGSTPCTACSPVDMRPSAGRFTCRAPPGIGAGVPITIDVGFDAAATAAAGAAAMGGGNNASGCTGARAGPGRCGTFSVFSVEALAATDGTAPAGAGSGAPASVYDGLYSVLPLPPRQGFLTVLSYAAPTIASVDPLDVAAAQPSSLQSAQYVDLTIAGAHFPPSPATTITLGDGHGNASCVAAVASNASAASCSVAMADLVAAATRISAAGSTSVSLAGRASLPLWVSYASPGWPASTALAPSSLGMTLSLAGLPVARAVAPQSGGAGLLLTITGSCFTDAAGSDGGSVSVTIGAAACSNVTILDDSALTCIAPAFEAAAAGAFVGTTVLPINVATALGDAATALALGTAGRGQPPLPAQLPVFRYSGQLRISWALNRSATPQAGGSGTGSGSGSTGAGDVTISGLAPIGPVPAALLERGNFTSCAVVPQGYVPASGPSWAVEGASRLDFGALPQRDARVAFPDAVLVASPAFAPFVANLTVACTDESTTPAATVRTETLAWPVAAPRVRWSAATSAFLSRRQLFLPSDSDTPPLAIAVDVAQPDSSGIGIGTGAASASRLPASSRVFASLLRYLTCTASIVLTHAQPSSASQAAASSALPAAAAPVTPPRLLGVQDGIANTTADAAAAAGLYTLAFPALSLAAAPLGSIVNVTAKCSWAPPTPAAPGSSASAVPPAYDALPALRLPVVAAAVQWVRLPPDLSRSNSYMEPPPSLALALVDPATGAPAAAAASLPSSARYRCEMDARKPEGATSGSGSSGSGVNGSSSGSSSGSGSGSGSGAADFLSLRQSLDASPADALTFSAFGVSARIRSRLTVTATCTLGSQTLPEATAVTTIAGCRPGQAPSGSSGWLCVDCPVGTFSRGGDDPCEACPRSGAECDGGTLRPLQGYFRPPQQAALRISATTELHQCPNPDACIVALNASAADAAGEVVYTCDALNGYGGVLCGQCLPGWAPFGVGVCAHCWSTGANAVVLAVLALLIVAAIGWLALFARPGSRSPSAISLRQLITFLQTVSVVTAFGAQAQLRALLGWTDVANGSVLSVGPVGCTIPASLPTRFYALLAAPAIVGGAIAAVAAVHALWAARRAVRDKAKAKAKASPLQGAAPHRKQGAGASAASAASAVPGRPGDSVGDFDAAVGLEVDLDLENPHPRPKPKPQSRPSLKPSGPLSSTPPHLPLPSHSSAPVGITGSFSGSWRSLLRRTGDQPRAQPHAQAPKKRAEAPVPLSLRLGSAMLTVSSLLAMPIVSTALRLLDCTAPVAGTAYVRSDLSVACGSPAHSAARAVAWAALAVIGLGFPAAIIYALARVPKQRPLRSLASSASMMSMHAGFEDEPEPEPEGGADMPATSSRSKHSSHSVASTAVEVASAPGDPPLVLRPLYDGYSRARGVLWWEGVTMLRKSILALVAALLGGTIRGLALVALLLAIAHALQGWVHPYDEPRFNAAESASSAAALAIALLALMYNSGAAAGIVTMGSGSGSGSETSASTASVIDAAAAAAVTAAIAVVLAPTLAFLLLQLLRTASSSGGIADRAWRYALRLGRRCGCARCLPAANSPSHESEPGPGLEGEGPGAYGPARKGIASATLGPVGRPAGPGASGTARSSREREELARRARLSLLASQPGLELTSMSMGAGSAARRSIVGAGAAAGAGRRRTSVAAKALPAASSSSASAFRLNSSGSMAEAAGVLSGEHHSGEHVPEASDLSPSSTSASASASSSWVENPIAAGTGSASSRGLSTDAEPAAASAAGPPGSTAQSQAHGQGRRRSAFGSSGEGSAPAARSRPSGVATSFAVMPLRARNNA